MIFWTCFLVNTNRQCNLGLKKIACLGKVLFVENTKMNVGSKHLGERIAFLRRLSGVSVPLLVERANIGMKGRPILKESTIRNLESGRKRDITISELTGVARGLDIPPTMILTDSLQPFELSFAEPFRTLGMTNFDVAFMIQMPNRVPDNGSGPVAPAARVLFRDSIQARRYVSDMDEASRLSLILRDRYEWSMLIIEREIASVERLLRTNRNLASRCKQEEDNLRETGDHIGLVYALRIRNLLARFENARHGLRMVQKTNGIPAVTDKETSRIWGDDPFGWPRAAGLDTDKKWLTKGIRTLLDEVGVETPSDLKHVDESVPRALIVLSNMYEEKGLNRRMTTSLSPLQPFEGPAGARNEALHLYFVAACLLAEVEDYPAIMSKIDLDSLNALFGPVITEFRLPLFEALV